VIKYINNNVKNHLNIKNKISNSPQNQINYTFSNTNPKIINWKNIKQKENAIFYLTKKKKIKQFFKKFYNLIKNDELQNIYYKNKNHINKSRNIQQNILKINSNLLNNNNNSISHFNRLKL
jgi:hypothetical protein